MIKVQGLVKSFGKLEVLKGIDYEVKEKEIICVIGPSGSGKSTFLRCINLLEDITAGEVFIDGVKVNDPKTDINAIRKEVGMVFQQFNLFPHMRVIDNITIAPKKLGKWLLRMLRSWRINCWRRLDLRIKRMSIPSNYQAAKCSGLRLLGHWPCSQR